MVMPGKINGAMVVDKVYFLVMETATIIKVNIVELKPEL